MKSIEIDRQGRTVHAEPGLLWGEVDAATQAYGLATPGGIVTHTGIAGLTVGGGLGWLMRKHGLSCDNLVACEVVTAEGKLVRASADEHADLFWSLQGGGGNFGIVTRFEYRLHPVGPEVLAGVVLYPAEQAGEVLRSYRDCVAGAPEELTTIVILTKAPPAPFLPEHLHGRPVVILAVCYAGDLAEGCQTACNLDPRSGVRPWSWTGSGRGFDPLPGVVVLELGGAQVAECGVNCRRRR